VTRCEAFIRGDDSYEESHYISCHSHSEVVASSEEGTEMQVTSREGAMRNMILPYSPIEPPKESHFQANVFGHV
jgi:hypothetical protein